MKVDWKYIAGTPGYVSLKVAYENSAMKADAFRKDALYKQFQWVINRAKHYAHYRGLNLDEVLDQWEVRRNYYWCNYYQDSNFPRLDVPDVKRGPLTLNKIRRIAKAGYRDPKLRQMYVFRTYMKMQREQSTKSPYRWTMVRKKRFKT